MLKACWRMNDGEIVDTNRRREFEDENSEEQREGSSVSRASGIGDQRSTDKHKNGACFGVFFFSPGRREGGDLAASGSRAIACILLQHERRSRYELIGWAGLKIICSAMRLQDPTYIGSRLPFYK